MNKYEIRELLDNRYTKLNFDKYDCCYCLKRKHTIQKCWFYNKQRKQNPQIENIAQYI